MEPLANWPADIWRYYVTYQSFFAAPVGKALWACPRVPEDRSGGVSVARRAAPEAPHAVWRAPGGVRTAFLSPATARQQGLTGAKRR